jgi:hypothetical protein
MALYLQHNVPQKFLAEEISHVLNDVLNILPVIDIVEDSSWLICWDKLVCVQVTSDFFLIFIIYFITILFYFHTVGCVAALTGGFTRRSLLSIPLRSGNSQAS